MKIRSISNLAVLAAAPVWLPVQLAKYRGHFLDAAEQAIERLFHEAPLRAAAQRAGIKTVNPFERFPGIDREKVCLVPGHWSSSHEQIEYPILSAICSLLKPKQIFEFGTFYGEATLMFAQASPEARLVTLNLPEGAEPALGIDDIQKEELICDRQIGRLFRGTPEESRIEQILSDSSHLDVSKHRDRYEFIWVDAGHSYENVKSDSALALQMVCKGGFVFWHDFDSSQPGLTRALLEISTNSKLFWIERTSIVGFEKL